jgi:predicted phosphodiesterase
MLWVLSMFLILSMVISLFVVALVQAPAEPTPEQVYTPWPTLAPTEAPGEPSPTPSAVPSPTPQPTQPVAGPELPSATPTITPTLTVTPTTTPAAANPALTFAVLGDSRDNPKVYAQVLQAVRRSGSQFVIHTGDMVSQGSDGEWKAFRQTMAGFPLPFYPVPGNHDARAGKLDGYLKYSGAPGSHYSLSFGPVHIALVDSHNGGLNAQELAWLRQDLSQASQAFKIVVLHHPAFDPDGTDHIMAYGNDAFLAIMQEQGVKAVFAGHIHAYAQAERNGVLYVYTGGGGAPLYRDGHANAFYHYLLVTVADEKVVIEVVKV